MPSEIPTSRREFLRGKAAARALVAKMQAVADRFGHAASPAGEAASAAGRCEPAAAAQLHATRRAMACEFAVHYHAADGPAATDAALAALDLVDALEAQLTIYRATSEILEVNRTAYTRAVAVEPQLFTLLEFCAWLHGETQGAFDITSGPASKAWGFLERQGRVPGDEEIAAAMANVGFDKVQLDRAQLTIQFRQPGVEINLNAVGKGYALDRVAQLMAERSVGDFLCHGGRSSVLARGRDRGDAAGGWRVAVPHPHDPQKSVGEVVLRDEALGTSGAGTQFFETGGRRFGHLIDPRSGHPAEGVITATAVAASAAEADALSTAFYILGPGGAAEYCAAHPDVGAVIVCPGDSPGAYDLHAFNLDSNRWRPA
jgi:thiamine biosynthesis lipoprotein